LLTLFNGDLHQRMEFIDFKGQLGGKFFRLIGQSLVTSQASSLRLVLSQKQLIVQCTLTRELLYLS
jgi:hypothetical protein